MPHPNSGVTFNQNIAATSGGALSTKSGNIVLGRYAADDFNEFVTLLMGQHKYDVTFSNQSVVGL